MNEVQFVVPGLPAGKGRHRSAPLMRDGKPVIGKGGRPIIIHHSDPKTVKYENLVALSAQAAMAGKGLISGAVFLELDIRLPIPKSWPAKKKAMAIQGLVAATKKPDCSNIQKSIEDGMNGVVYVDDVQIVKGTQSKRYAETPGVVVIVRELELMSA